MSSRDVVIFGEGSQMARRIFEAIAIAALSAAFTKILTYGIDKGIEALQSRGKKDKSPEIDKEKQCQTGVKTTSGSSDQSE